MHTDPVAGPSGSTDLPCPALLAVLLLLSVSVGCEDVTGSGQGAPPEILGRPIGATAAPTGSGWSSRTVLWSPDGLEVIHVAGERGNDTWIEGLAVETGVRRTITEADARFLQAPADAAWIYASTYDPIRGADIIRRYAADGGGADESFELETYPAPFAITPDGSRVLHLGQSSYELALTVVGDTSRLLLSDHAGQPHALSRDGSTALHGGTRQVWSTDVASLTTDTLWTGIGAAEAGVLMYIAWGEDGQPLILHNDGGTLRLLDTEAGRERSAPLASEYAHIGSARVGPDRVTLAAWIWTECLEEETGLWPRCLSSQWELRLVDLETGATSTVARVVPKHSFAPPEFSPDGGSLVYAVDGILYVDEVH